MVPTPENQVAHRARSRAYRARFPERAYAAKRRWTLAHPEAVKLHDRRAKVKAAYGMTLEEYDALLAEGCRVCGQEATVMDHNHKTNQRRGPLCSPHNLGLGHFADDPAMLRAAAAYLEGSDA